MDVLIVGGGVAGPATALALDRVGIASSVLEGRPAPTGEEGSWLTLAPNGLAALQALDALDPLRPHAVASRWNRLCSATGRTLGTLSLGRPLDDGTPALTVRRSRLAAVLAEQAAGRGIRIRHDAPVVAVEPGDRGVDVVLGGGERLRADLVIGADGVHSRTRRAIDPDAPAARYVGLTNFGGITRRTPLAAELPARTWTFTFGRRAFTGLHPTPDGDVVWFANVPRDPIGPEERAATSDAAWQRWLVDLVADDAGHAAALIEAGELELAADSTHDLGHVPTWHRAGVVIVGDAAHAPSPSSGQGAAMALEDAVVLARSLRDHPQPHEALAAYERIRRPRVERIVAAGARSSSAKTPGPVGRVLRDAVLRLVLRFAVTDRSTAWMTDHRVDLGVDAPPPG